MINFIKNKIALNKTKRELIRIERFYERLIIKAKKERKSEKDIYDLYSEMSAESSIPQFEMDRIISKQLISHANRLQLPVPKYDNETMWDNDYGYRILTEAGKIHLKSIIKKENREKLDIFVKVAALIISILSLIIALVSVAKI